MSPSRNWNSVAALPFQFEPTLPACKTRPFTPSSSSVASSERAADMALMPPGSPAPGSKRLQPISAFQTFGEALVLLLQPFGTGGQHPCQRRQHVGELSGAGDLLGGEGV